VQITSIYVNSWAVLLEPFIEHRIGFISKIIGSLAQNRFSVIVKVVVPNSVPLALKIFAVPEPLKEFRVEPNVTSEVATIYPENFPVGSKTKFFILNL